MAHTLEQFAADCHRILKADPSPAGRQQVCTLLQEVLKDDDFIATHLGDNVPERGARECAARSRPLLGDLWTGPWGDRDDRLGAGGARRFR